MTVKNYDEGGALPGIQQTPDAEFASDPNVQAGKAALEAAKQALEVARSIDITSPEWVKVYGRDAISAGKDKFAQVSAAQTAVEEAHHNYQASLATAIRAKRAGADQAKQDELKRQREAREADQARQEEARQKSLYFDRWRQAGGTSDGFEASWPSMWAEHLKREAQSGFDQHRAMMRQQYQKLA